MFVPEGSRGDGGKKTRDMVEKNEHKEQAVHCIMEAQSNNFVTKMFK